MDTTRTFHVTVQIGLADHDDELLDRLARQLLDELNEQQVESVELASAGAAPAGTKSAEAVTLGALAVTLLPSVLPKLVEFCQAWALRGEGRTVKFKGNLGGKDIEFEGKAEDLQRVLALLTATPPATSAA